MTSDGGESWSSAGLDALFVIALAYDQFHAITAAVFNVGVARSSEIISPGRTRSARFGGPSQNYPNPLTRHVDRLHGSVGVPRGPSIYDLLGRVAGHLWIGI